MTLLLKEDIAAKGHLKMTGNELVFLKFVFYQEKLFSSKDKQILLNYSNYMVSYTVCLQIVTILLLH